MAHDDTLAKPTAWYFDAPQPKETLRDKLAIGALPGVMQELIAMDCLDTTNEELAKRCYAVADAFMKVRGE